MKNIKHILKTQFNIECTDIIQIHGGLSTMNFKINSDEKTFFLKVYDKKKAQSSLWIENINCYMPILMWLNEISNLKGKIIRPIKTIKGDFSFDCDENVFLLFDYINGESVGKDMTNAQVVESADILACLHSSCLEISTNIDKIKEDFSVPFCFSLEHYLIENYSSSPDDVKEILQPCLDKLISVINKVKLLSEKVKRKNIQMVICHTDAHGFNFLQSDRLVLVDWEGLKIAPVEADLIMFTKKEYWSLFIEQYNKLRPNYILDNEILLFYVMRRKIEDIWAFIESILHDNLSNDQRKCDLLFLSECCNSLNNLYFEL